MEKQLNERIDSILAKLKTSLGGADIRLKDIDKGVVTLEYHRPMSNPSACHVDRTKLTKDILTELLEDEFKVIIPDFKSVVILGEE
jgi:hypothetical protein